MTPDPSIRPRLHRNMVWLGLGICMLLVVGVLSLIPVPEMGGHSDKVSHVTAYFGMAAWFAMLAANRVGLAVSMAGLVAYGALIELVQGMTGYRFAEWLDFGANTLGVALGSLVYFSRLRRLLESADAWLDHLLQG